MNVVSWGFNNKDVFFFFQAQYLIILCGFKDQLQQHVRVHAVEAVMACREIENTLQALTGSSFSFSDTLQVQNFIHVYAIKSSLSSLEYMFVM